MAHYKDQLSKIHPIYTLYVEHEQILRILKQLDDLNEKIQKMKTYNPDIDIFPTLINLSQQLLDAENHHKREEEVLFIELERRNITGPTQVMRSEHDDLRLKKKALKDVVENVGNMDFSEFKKQVNELVKYIVFTLTNHIFKENNVLYPASLRTIQSQNKWDEMKKQCDKIGYCPYTPSL